MINPHDGVLTFDQPPLRIAPTLTRSEFLAASWSKPSTDWILNAPWCSWKLDFECRSTSVSFIVVFYFHDERLAMIEMSNADAKFGTSWHDYSLEKELQRDQTHIAWLTECLGPERSFTWGTVRTGGYDDPHGGGGASIQIRYAG